MNAPDNQRRARRKRTSGTATVTNVISGQPMGNLGNLSADGMLLISPQAPRSGALYQVSVNLSGAGQSHPIEAGIQEQWHEPAAIPGQVWAGYRIIAIDEADANRLAQWLADA